MGVHKRSYPDISYYGAFGSHNTENYIAQALERKGCKVYYNEKGGDITLYAKRPVAAETPRVCWVFDLFRGYPGRSLSQLSGDIIITTDGGDGHHTIRQGIDAPQKQMISGTRDIDVAFVGAPYYEDRKRMIRETGAYLVQNTYQMALNELLGRTKIVLGDSYPADYYWSNRVYEVTGRGGFLIHPETKGLPDYIPQFQRGREQEVIQYYLEHEDEREALRMKQFAMCPTYDDRADEFLALLAHEL